VVYRKFLPTKEVATIPDSISILALSRTRYTQSELWDELDEACYALASRDESQITFNDYSAEPRIHPTGERVRMVWATFVLPDVGTAEVILHIGNDDRMIYTGYDDEGFLDFFRVRTGDNVFEDSVPRVERGHDDYPAWEVVSPLKMAVFYRLVAKLIEGRPVIDQPLMDHEENGVGC
jgi:hypothetical protein